MKKIILAAVMGSCLAGSSLTALSAPGDIAGNMYYTDIKTYIYHSPVTSYNIGGKTVIDAEILNWHYGFDVYWYADTRRLEITDKGGEFNSLQAMSGELVESVEGTVGEKFSVYYETDIVTTLNGSPIESYNIGGRTFIVAEAMRDFGYTVDWDAEKRTLTISKPMDFYKIETDMGTIKSRYDNKRPTVYVVKTTNPLVSDSDYNLYEINMTSSRVLQGPGVGDSYIRLADVIDYLNAECSLVESTQSSHTEWVNGVSYDTESYEYYIDLKYDAGAEYSVVPHSPDTSSDTALTPIKADVYDLPVGLVINGEISAFTTMAGGKEYEIQPWAIDNEIYIPVHTLAKLIGYN